MSLALGSLNIGCLLAHITHSEKRQREKASLYKGRPKIQLPNLLMRAPTLFYIPHPAFSIPQPASRFEHLFI